MAKNDHSDAIEILARARAVLIKCRPDTKQERIRREEKLSSLKASIKKLQS